jgi:hypothetical protein
VDDKTGKYLSDLIETVEYLWLEGKAAQHLLEQYQVPRWREYCERPESKAQARLHFDLARKLIQQAQTDSKVLESLESALRTPERPKN